MVARSLQLNLFDNSSKFQLFDIERCHQNEIIIYINWVKKYRKLYKAMFHKYATLYNNKVSLKAKTFDLMRSQQQKMSLTEIFQFLNDFQMNKKFNVKREDIQRLIKLINLRNDPDGRNNSELDIDGFMEFILQIGHFAHD